MLGIDSSKYSITINTIQKLFVGQGSKFRSLHSVSWYSEFLCYGFGGLNIITCDHNHLYSSIMTDTDSLFNFLSGRIYNTLESYEDQVRFTVFFIFFTVVCDILVSKSQYSHRLIRKLRIVLYDSLSVLRSHRTDLSLIEDRCTEWKQHLRCSFCHNDMVVFIFIDDAHHLPCRIKWEFVSIRIRVLERVSIYPSFDSADDETSFCRISNYGIVV